MNNLPKLFIIIDDAKISLIAGHDNDQNSFEILEKLILPIDGICQNKITDLDKITNLIKRNILIIEHKVNYTFKDTIVILNNLEISFLNLCGFKKLNGTQITKENITYILNSQKSNINLTENKNKILHIFNSKYILDKKKLDNLPIGLFGDFYSHELSFVMIKENDFKNLKNIFDQCNLKIKKILLDSYVKGSLLSNENPQADSFIFIELKENLSKIFYLEDGSIKYEQRFEFGTDLICKDISKITSLKEEIIKIIIDQNEDIVKVPDDEFLEKQFFHNLQFRKIKKKLIYEIAEARICEFYDLMLFNNVNLKKVKEKINLIYLQTINQKSFNCFKSAYINNLSKRNKFQVEISNNDKTNEMIEMANTLVNYGWKKEAIPITTPKKSLITKIFQRFFS